MTQSFERAVVPLLLCCSAISCSEPSPPIPKAPSLGVRYSLLDLMDVAERSGATRGAETPAETALFELSFETSPAPLWFAHVNGRRLEYADDSAEFVTLGPGLNGQALTIGPGDIAETSRALLVLPAAPLARVKITGRVQNEGNPRSDDASSREVFRIYEHDEPEIDPTQVSRWGRSRESTHRVSRRVDPSGWDTLETEFISKSSTQSLELAFLHRSGDSESAITRFDEFRIEVTPLGPAALEQHMVDRWRPRDGQEQETPWRLRVALTSEDGHRSEVRDSILLTPPSEIAFPIEVAPAADGPRLRFHYGMPPESFGVPGDGARLEVRFEDSDGKATELGAVEFDPKNNRDERRWRGLAVDMAAVGGQSGQLIFRSADIAGSPEDLLDAVLLATPRIEVTNVDPTVPNVLLIGVDTLRADRMSAFGYERDTTPNLKRLGEAGVRFSKTRSQAPWTLPSFSSILTSLYPSVHGAGRGGHDLWTPIDPTTLAFPEILARIGYETQGIVANGLISPHYGLDQGFAGYQSAWKMESAERDEEAVSNWIDEHRSTPWLMFWHIMDPHLPYITDKSYRDQFTEAGYDGRFSEGESGPNVPFGVLDPRPGRRWFTHEGPPPPPDLEERDRRFVHEYYEAEIAEMDAAVGRVLDTLRESGQWDRTLVAFIADHGEGLGEHNHYHHGYTLFDDQVHIPMILRIPGRDEGRIIDRSVAAIDLAPTLIAALGLSVPDAFQGVDRLSPNAPTDDPYFIEYPTYDSSAQKAWVLGEFKYMHDPVFHTEALYHLGEDPLEQTDVASLHPEIVERARKDLDAFRWERLQKGRFHLRVTGNEGDLLSLRVTTDDLFDANFTSLPAVPEEHFAMDLDRTRLELETKLVRDRIDLVFWCRGTSLNFDLNLNGLPVTVVIDDEGRSRSEAFEIRAGEIESNEGSQLGWPDEDTARLWLERGVQELLPVTLSPEELEALRELGYTR